MGTGTQGLGRAALPAMTCRCVSAAALLAGILGTPLPRLHDPWLSASQFALAHRLLARTESEIPTNASPWKLAAVRPARCCCPALAYLRRFSILTCCSYRRAATGASCCFRAGTGTCTEISKSSRNTRRCTWSAPAAHGTQATASKTANTVHTA